MLYVLGITLDSDNYWRKKSHTITVCGWCRTDLAFFILGLHRSAHLFLSEAAVSWKTNQLNCVWLNLIFCGTVCDQKNIWRSLTITQHFRSILKIDPKPVKISLILKWLLWCYYLISQRSLLSFLCRIVGHGI